MRNLSILILSAVLCGCATIEENPNTAKLVTQYAVLKFDEQSSPARRAERMANVVRIATDVKAIAANEVTSVSSIRGVVATQIAKLNLSPADQLLANGLADILAQELAKRVGDGALDAEQRLIVGQVMDWVLEAAAMVQ
jgi:hypothetical protein